MTENNPRSRELQLASPSLYNKLLKALTLEDFELCCQAYSIGVEYDSLRELGLCRKPDASYNPKPARLASILIDELSSYQPILLQAAFMFLISCHQDQLPGLLKPAFSLANSASQAFNSLMFNNTYLACSSIDSYYLFLAACLDFYRHLHLTNFSHTEKQKHHAQVQLILDNISFDSNNRVIKLITFWFDTQKSKYAS